MAAKKSDKDPNEAKPARRAAVARRRLEPPPVLLAGMDIGSTAARMSIAEYLPDSPIRVIEELTHPIATGADTFRHGYILPETIRSICKILDNFLRLLDDYGVQNRRVVASSAIREAANREVLVDRIRHNSGLELEILDAVEESRFAYQALLPWFRQNPAGHSLALNIGGGSTEIMILRGEDLQLGGTKRMGTSRLFHYAGSGGSQAKFEILQATAANMVNSTRETYQEYSISGFFLINRILYHAFRGDPASERHEADFVMPAEALHDRLQQSYGLSPFQLGQKFNMGLAEVELLIPAMMILDNFVGAVEAKEITFTNTEMLTGLLVEMGMAIRGEIPLMSFHRQIVRSARAVGEKFYYDRSHARVVTDFSLTIFDALRGFLDLSDQDRLLLELSAVLHDVGMYVSERHHHRHSAYLIEWSDIVGLNAADRTLASQIAFFHRKEIPSSGHPGYMALSRRDRMRVSKLAGILRLADVLDRGHSQQVKNLRVEVAGDRLLLYLQVTGDLGLIVDALPKKADLMEMVSGLEIVLRRELPKT